jgi:hypothetical protein
MIIRRVWHRPSRGAFKGGTHAEPESTLAASDLVIAVRGGKGQVPARFQRWPRFHVPDRLGTGLKRLRASGRAALRALVALERKRLPALALCVGCCQTWPHAAPAFLQGHRKGRGLPRLLGLFASRS